MKMQNFICFNYHSKLLDQMANSNDGIRLTTVLRSGKTVEHMAILPESDLPIHFWLRRPREFDVSFKLASSALFSIGSIITSFEVWNQSVDVTTRENESDWRNWKRIELNWNWERKKKNAILCRFFKIFFYRILWNSNWTCQPYQLIRSMT